MLLDFEKPIADLEAKLAEMKQQLDVDHNEELQRAVRSFEENILKLKRETFQNLTRWQRVQLSRHNDRPYTLDYIYGITDQFVELHGDRTVKDDKAMVGGFGTIDGQTIMFIGQQKGRNTKQRQLRNFGMANPEGYRKALRLMKMAEKFKNPLSRSLIRQVPFRTGSRGTGDKARLLPVICGKCLCSKYPLSASLSGKGLRAGPWALPSVTGY